MWWQAFGILICLSIGGASGIMTCMAVTDNDGWDRNSQALGAAILAFVTGLALAALLWLVQS